ncbi:TonB-dependent receptor plug domain-containing protein [Idiomarina aminovorans]|uniref:TonB-dependent receptor plug domain-containing protein n=1 Tax=Idiomarina aminovorans TaxID=2914829 RepID=UPI0020052823|nr:TonB-dependent receptor [Idiomarina sp. ATCH4]MCK7460395.1 TonB-dependent receptor [Idiomarina sp. ATCH4]
MSLNLSSTFPLSVIAVTLISLTSPVAAKEPLKIDEIIQIKTTKTNSQLGDTSQILREQGVDFSAAGGVSAQPILNGMMGDRVKVSIDGAEPTASCANQMNPPLSYISASQVETSQVIAGISPVRMGGDNIAGVIHVDQINPEFSDQQPLSWSQGYLAAEYQSNASRWLTSAGAEWSSRTLNIKYQGAYEDAESYDDGNSKRVLDTLYRAQNHTLIGAWKSARQQLSLKISHQDIPFQGFANQYMDMTKNRSTGITARYQSKLNNNGEFQAQLNWQGVEHEMGFFTPEKTGMMPMVTDAEDFSYKLAWQWPVLNGGTFYAGQETLFYQLDDYWPALEASAMMGPDDYVNINDGERRRIAAYTELDWQLAQQWQFSSGIRLEQVHTDTGEVQPYNRMPMMGMPNADAAAADNFNASDRSQSDWLIDATFTSVYTINAEQSLELGIARKNRAPNLYERYSWGRGIMATTMIGWFGDANGYVGDPDLKPETAHTLSASYEYSSNNNWQVSVSPYYTKISDAIDADVIGQFNRAEVPAGQRNIMQIVNEDADLIGIDVNAQKVWNTSVFLGQLDLQGRVSYTRGERDSDNQPLYQIKPLNSQLILSQENGNWLQSLSWEWVDEKDRVDPRRLENETDSYHLVNWQGQYSWSQLTLSLAVTNLFDTFYRQPLGGVSIAQYKQTPEQGFNNIPGAGRSVNFGIRYSF